MSKQETARGWEISFSGQTCWVHCREKVMHLHRLHFWDVRVNTGFGVFRFQTNEIIFLQGRGYLVHFIML